MATTKKSEVKDETTIEVTEDNAVIETTSEEVLDETAALDSLKPNSAPVGPANKSVAFDKIVNAMVGLDQETINKFVASIEQIGKEAKNISDGAAAANKNSIDAKPSGAVKEELEEAINNVLNEDLTALFDGSDLKEDFRTKFAVLFESAVNIKVGQKTLELEEEFENRLNEEVESLTESLVESLDEYLDYTANAWLSENEVAITSTLKSDLTEQFLEDLHTLFATNYINIPEDKIDVIEEMNERIETLEEIINSKIDENMELAKTIEETKSIVSELEVKNAFNEFKEGLTESEIEKLSTLSESIEYDSVEDFKSKVSILKETHFKADAKTASTTILFEEVETIEEEKAEPKLTAPMASYLSAIKNNKR
jgi:hypothetical protein